MSISAPREVIVVHSSDLHLGADNVFGPSRACDTLPALRGVLAAAGAVRADIVVLAGDTFDNNRQSPELVDRAVRVMSDAAIPIVILPGNHDPLTPDSVYHLRKSWIDSNVRILGLNDEEAMVFSDLELEVRGKAHRDYSDMPPLLGGRSRSTRWRLTAAHGHYVEEPDQPGKLLGSWLIRREDLIAANADYIALGHWNRAARVGDRQTNAYYCGSPEYARTVNVIRLRKDGEVKVSQAPLAAPPVP